MDEMELRQLRRSRGLTVEQMAVLAGVDKSTISRAERGLQTLRPESVVRISKALKVSPSRIVEVD
jgi:transcriptional regulator with XRE-family HTH domain